jgi:Asp-tRNA(Asn)/Glu-tRNA(Gln) amidotransferase A subunit family amidase
MQPLKPRFQHPDRTSFGDIQYCVRTNDIDLVGDGTRPFGILGLPTISIPCGFTKAGLPIGMQITGAPWAEATVLRLARTYQQETDWHTRRPAVAG